MRIPGTPVKSRPHFQPYSPPSHTIAQAFVIVRVQVPRLASPPPCFALRLTTLSSPRRHPDYLLHISIRRTCSSTSWPCLSDPVLHPPAASLSARLNARTPSSAGAARRRKVAVARAATHNSTCAVNDHFYKLLRLRLTDYLRRAEQSVVAANRYVGPLPPTATLPPPYAIDTIVSLDAAHSM